MFSLPLPLIGLSFLIAIALCVHAVRTGQQMYWLWIILAFQPIGGIVYFVAIIAPAWFGGRTAQKMGQAARKAIDPRREYREAAQAVDDAPTVANRVRLAVAATELGKHAEAEKLYADSLTGMYADDPQLLLGRANALIELNRPAEALPLLRRALRDRYHPKALAERGWRSLRGMGELLAGLPGDVSRLLRAARRPVVVNPKPGRVEAFRRVLPAGTPILNWGCKDRAGDPA